MMEKVLIVSDSHGLTDELQMIKQRHHVSHMIHCGDSELSIDDQAMEGFIKVAGNCDRDSRYENEQIVDIAGFKFFITHGHLFKVKRNLLPLSYRAAEVGANIICFGHSHVAGAEKMNQQIYINPGSIQMPRGRTEKSYAILEWIDENDICVKFFKTTGESIDDLSTTFRLM